jgi:undecaprenyl-diphosphatase
MIVQIDHQIMAFAYTLRQPWLNPFVIDFTGLGSSIVIATLVVVLLLMLYSAGQSRAAAQLVFAVLGGAVLFRILKLYALRERPDIAHRLVVATGYSFPSGHSVNAAVFYFTLALLARQLFKENLQPGLLFCVSAGLTLLVGLSRIYLGVHYPSDVLAGFFLGITWALIVNRIFSHNLKGLPLPG